MKWIPFVFPAVNGVRCAFGTRLAGNISLESANDPVRALDARIAFMKTHGVDHWQELRQVHGDSMVFDPEPRSPSTPGTEQADGLGTSLPGQALAIKTADCQPVLLAHASGAYVAALHVGWRGNRMGFVQSGVEAFCGRYGLAPEDVCAVRGPSLGPGASEFVNYDAEWGPQFDAWLDPVRRTVDLWRMTRSQLLEAGLRQDRLFSLDLCTNSLEELFFSYRRNREAGRQASLIWINR